MLGSTSGMMKCLGCNKNKPKTDFGTAGNARALCSQCRSGRVVSTSKNKSGGKRILDAIEDFFDELLFL